MPIVPVDEKLPPVIGAVVQTQVTVPPASVTVNVMVSEVLSVVIAIPEPTKFTVSLFESAIISSSPETANVLKIHCCEPLSVLQTVIEPLPVIGLPETEIPVPAVSPTLVTVPVQAVAVEQKVTESNVLFVEIDIFVPAINVRLSLLVSAVTVSSPETIIFLKIHCEEPLSIFVTVISPLLVIGLPDTLNPPPFTKPILVTVPVQEVFELNVLQSALDNAPLFEALAVGKLKVKVPASVIGLPVTLKSVPDVPTAPQTSVTEPEQFENGKSDIDTLITLSDEF